MKINVEDLGLLEYKSAWEYQEEVNSKLIRRKLEARNSGLMANDDQYFLICEHPHVFTLGKSGVVENLLINPDFLSKIGATYFKSDRGGDITYHGPGQIVGYPIFDLEQFNLQIRSYIHLLEESIILTLRHFRIKAERLPGATGVWLDTEVPGKTRKICAIGVKASRYVTMHGFALNVNTDLKYFSYINPCGFIDKGVTSMEKELGKTLDIEHIKSVLIKSVLAVFDK